MSRLQTINASASPEVQINENFDAVAPNALFARKATATAGLTWGYYGGILPQTYANIPDDMTLATVELEWFIAQTPCDGLKGVLTKLQLMRYALRNYQDDGLFMWDSILLDTAINALTRMANHV